VRIVKRKQKGLPSKLIAKQFDISTRRVEQIWSNFQKNKTYLVLKKQGRKPYREYSDNIAEKIINIRKKYRFGATYIAKYLRDNT